MFRLFMVLLITFSIWVGYSAWKTGKPIADIFSWTITESKSSLDRLVSRASENSPVVLGVNITNQGIVRITDLLQNLPENQLREVRKIICEPAATSSAK